MRGFDTIPAHISFVQAYLVIHIAVNTQYYEKIFDNCIRLNRSTKHCLPSLTQDVYWL
jgi:hypothetical protein